MNVNSNAIRRVLSSCLAVLIILSTASTSYSQRSAVGTPPVHYNSEGVRSPGFLGQQRLHMGGPVQGYYQPVLITGPRGVKISMTYQGEFTPLKPMPNVVGLLIGQVYRIRITNFPLLETQGAELYPTLEIIDRIYAPQGKEVKNPIVVEISLEDIKEALKGNLVTRVIYLEDPNNPIPTVNPPNSYQSTLDIPADADPVAVADTMGRPVAIMRLGGRMPIRTHEGLLSEEFQFGSPSFIDYNTNVPATRKSTTTFAPAKPAAAQTPDAKSQKPAEEVPVDQPAIPENQPENNDGFDDIEF
ncbi:MAG: hypothetical protein IJQ39_00685 [Thermoguttaceae bacterium]|nr:hypothetical protein [Thermoguttaceae bacterium]